MSLQKYFIAIVTVTFLMNSCIGDKGLPAKEKNDELSSKIEENIVDHSQWDHLLEKYVNDKGYVDYSGFQADSSKLNNYLNGLAEQPPKESWSIEEQLAYYINIYNAATVQLIIRSNMPGSIKDITEDGGPWNRSFINIGDKMVSLATVEKGILQPMKEPRIHFAINCASESCPKLLNEAFTAKNVKELMEQATNEFINGPRNIITADSAKVSSIFQFYPSDFKINGIKSIREYINQYSNVKINEDAEITYIPYDWSLNNQQNIP